MRPAFPGQSPPSSPDRGSSSTVCLSALPPVAMFGSGQHYRLGSIKEYVQGSGVLSHRDIPQWGAADAEIKVPVDENT